MIDKIGQLANVQQAYQSQIRKDSGDDKVERKDRADTSAQAQRSEGLRQAVSQAVREAPDVRADRVADARRKLEQGNLLSDRVVDEIAERIVDSMGIG